LKRRLTWGLLAVLPTIALGQTPAPDTEPAAVVSVGNCTAPGSANLPRALRNSLKSLGTPVLTEAETVAPLGGASLRSIPELKKALDDARDDFINGQVERALKSLQALSEEVSHLAPSAERWELQRSVLINLAQVQDRTDKPAAQAILRRILAVEPAYAPDPSVFPPSFLAEVAKARTVVTQSPTNGLAVTTDPSGTGVAVGGRPMGPSPLTTRLVPGTYRIEGMWGYRGLAKSVNVDAPPEPPAKVGLSKSVEGSIVPDAGPCLFPIPTRDAALARVAGLLKVKRVYAVRTEVSGTEQTLVVEEFDATTGRDVLERREPIVPPGPVTDAAARLAQSLTAPSRVAESTASPPSTVNSGLRLSSYIIGGVGVVATTIGVILFINGNSTINGLNNQYTQGGNSFPAGFESSFQSQNSSGKSDKTIGAIVGLTGIAALATGVTLFFVSANGGGSSNVTIAPYVQPGSGGAVLVGRF
jgi:hypothetical protein